MDDMAGDVASEDEEQAADPVERVIAGRYRLVSVIGHGSMGTVWRAYDEFLHRPVAVKEIRVPLGMPEEHADEVRERTLREARAIGALSHPNVVTLHDIAHENGDPYVVMELVPGSSLAHLLRAVGPLETVQVAAVAEAVAAALQAAHQAGITHRDVKPANVLIATDGRIKLADFGIARNISENTLTKTGITLGSPAYIAPEVASGGAVTHNADLWSLGATLYAAAEGHAPYDPDGDVIATLLEVVNGSVPQPESAGGMTDVVTGLMVKEPDQRMSLAEVRRRIYGLLPEPGTSPFSLEQLAEVDNFVPELKPEPASRPEGDEEPADPPELAELPDGDPDDGPGLAADPGPLPFTSTPMSAEPPPRARRGVPRPLVYAAAFVLFVVAAAGAFAAARYAGGKPLLPAKPATIEQPVVEPPAPPPSGEFVARSGNAATLKGTKGGTFSVKVPPGWDQFVEEKQSRNLPPSTRVHYLSPDGRYALTVERFPGFYPAHRIGKDLVPTLTSTWPGRGDFRASDPQEDAQLGTGPEPGRVQKYNTVDMGSLRRTTFSRMIPMGADLWVVGLTVPTVEEDTGSALFDRIAPTFTTP